MKCAEMHKDTQEGCSTECYSDYLHEKRSSTRVGDLFSCRYLCISPALRAAPRGDTPFGPPGRGISRPKASEGRASVIFFALIPMFSPIFVIIDSS